MKFNITLFLLLIFSSSHANYLTFKDLDKLEALGTVVERIDAKVTDLHHDSEFIYALTKSTIFKISINNITNISEINLPTLSSPEGFDFDMEGNIFIADTGADRIVKLLVANNYQEDPTFILNKGGSEEGQLLSPMDVTISSRDQSLKVYVLDTGNNRVQIFDSKGKYLAQFNGSTTPEGKLNNPLNMIGGSNLIITDYGNNMIRELSYNIQTQQEQSRVIVDIENSGKVSYSDRGLFSANNTINELQVISNQGNILQNIPMSKTINLSLLYEQSHQLIYQETGSTKLKHIFIPKTTEEFAPLALSKKFVKAFLSKDDKTIYKYTPVRLLKALKSPGVVDKVNTVFPLLQDYKENIYFYGLKAVVVAKAPTLPNDVIISFNFSWQKDRWILSSVR